MTEQLDLTAYDEFLKEAPGLDEDTLRQWTIRRAGIGLHQSGLLLSPSTYSGEKAVAEVQRVVGAMLISRREIHPNTVRGLGQAAIAVLGLHAGACLAQSPSRDYEPSYTDEDMLGDNMVSLDVWVPYRLGAFIKASLGIYLDSQELGWGGSLAAVPYDSLGLQADDEANFKRNCDAQECLTAFITETLQRSGRDGGMSHG